MIDNLTNIFLIIVEYWKNNFLDIAIAIGTIGAALGAYNASKVAISLHNKLENKKEIENYISEINLKLGFLRGVRAEIYLEQQYFSFKRNHMKENKTPLYRNGPIDNINSFYENNLDKLSLFEDENLILHIQKLFLDIRVNYSNLNLIRENSLDFKGLDRSAMLETDKDRLIKIKEECKEDEKLYISVIDGFISAIDIFEKDSNYLMKRIDYIILELLKDLKRVKIPTE